MKRRGALLHNVQRPRKKKKYFDPQRKRLADARVRKNTARQTVLEEQRALARGDPVRGKPEPTPFVKSLDAAMSPEEAANMAADMAESRPSSSAQAKQSYLTNFVYPEELDATLARSKEWVNHPKETRAGAIDPTKEERIAQLQQREHETATEAMKRILAVPTGNQRQKKHINIQRCIDEFGRHNTSKLFVAKTPGAAMTEATTTDESAIAEAQAESRATAEKARIGPDTGSSEVQIAILTAKIRRLSDEQATRGGQDKVNKRNLRVLVHRRQRLLQYFLRKSRGGPAWEHLTETLGLTPATWKGEIVL